MTIVPLNDLSRLSQAEVASILNLTESILQEGAYLKGDWTKQLEQQLSSNLSKYVTCVGNGTDALNLAMMLIGAKDKKVVTVANAGGYSTGAILRAGGRPLFVDVDASTGQMDMNDLESVLNQNSHIAAVVVTHLYGQLADIERARDLCDEYKVLMIEDCAQGLGCKLNGLEAGSWGDLSTLSFYPTKNLGAIGDGGAIGVKDPNMFELAKSLSQYGWGKRYEIQNELGFNTRIDEIQAAVILSRLTSFDSENETRRAIVNRYSTAIQGERYFLSTGDERYVGHLAVLVTNTREKDENALNSRGVSTGVHYPILDIDQAAWKSHFSETNLPISKQLVSRILTIPCFPSMTEDEIVKVMNALSELDRND
jgi:dTDP-4-amino-4,6-dideoxygalactose transaminase